MKKIVLFLMMVLLPGVVSATAITEPLSFSAPGYDSVRCSVFVLNRATGAYALHAAAYYVTLNFPKDTNITIQNDSLYRVKQYWWAPGESDPAFVT